MGVPPPSQENVQEATVTTGATRIGTPTQKQLVRHSSLPRRKGGGEASVGERHTSTFCTGSRRELKLRPLDLKQSPLCMQLGSAEGGGLSNSLSTESLRQSCGMYEHDGVNNYEEDELTDDDFIEVQSTPTGFPKQQQTLQQQHPTSGTTSNVAARALHSFVSQTRKQRRNSDESPLAAEEHEEVDALYDPLSVLNELDAILDSHGDGNDGACSGEGSEQFLNLYADDETSFNADDEPKVEDCLLDLDNYLEEMDADDSRSGTTYVSPTLQLQNTAHTLPLKRKTSLAQGKSATLNSGVMQRGHPLRRTNGSTPPSIATAANLKASEETYNVDFPPSFENQQLWRRQSMRHTDTYIIPDCHNATTAPTTTVTAPVATFMPSQMPLPTSQISLITHTPTSSSLSPLASNNSTEMLTQEDIFQNLLLQHGFQRELEHEGERPRQFGRRASGHPRVLSLRCDIEPPTRAGCTIVGHNQRPRSAPVAGRDLTQQQHTIISHSASDVSSVCSSHNASPLSLALTSTDASSSSTVVSSAVIGHASANEQSPQTGLATMQLESSMDPSVATNAPTAAISSSSTGINARWPHEYSRTLAVLCCTLGLFNICRFAVLTVHYGGNFLLQFLLLSIIFGIPMLWLQMCLGAKIRAGPVCMWKISPICRGIGIALVLVQSLMAIYSTAAITWLLVYLKDSFPSAMDGSSNATATVPPLYRWQDSFHPYRVSFNVSAASTVNITECAADYFNIVVLQRLQFVRHRDSNEIHFRVNDRLAFTMAILWAIVFLILCKGLRSLGKLILPLTLLPLLMLTVITGKFMSIVDLSKLQNVISATDFDDFLINSKTWTAAAQETFLTWGLLGAAVMAMASRSHDKANGSNITNKTSLRRDALLVVVLTLMGLTLAALLGLCCMQVLAQHEYIYVPGSYEHPDTYIAIHSLKSPTLNAQLLSYPPKWVPHYSSFIGETYKRPAILVHRESGYQALRFISEFFPAVAVLAADSISWIWIALTFITLFVFGLTQLCAMWKPISCTLGNSTSSVLLSCVTGLLLSIPFATEMGITLLHYMDLLLGGAWFIPLLWTSQIFGVFLIRGRPYNGDDLVNDLHMSASLSAFLALSWNVLLPLGLIALTVVEYKISASNQFYYWRGKSYFSYWSRKVGGLTQVCLLLLVPLTALVQIYRYMSSGPPDILDRIQLLYRPNGYRSSTRRLNGESVRGGADGSNFAGRRNGIHGAVNLNPNSTLVHEDAPPKYTPPPSYTTATGARLAKIFRQSIRRSVRRLLGDTRTRPILSLDTELNQPPDYSTTERSSVNVNISESLETTTDNVNHATANTTTTPSATTPPPISIITNYTRRSHTLGSSVGGGRKNRWPYDFSVYQENTNRRLASAPRSLEDNRQQRPYTAADVVTVLGCASLTSTRTRRGEQSDNIPLSGHIDINHVEPQQSLPQPLDSPNRNSFRSIENLILNEEPLGHSASAVANVIAAAAATNNNNIQNRDHNNGEPNASSVI